MALLQTRLHSGTTGHAFAQRIVCNLEAAINRVAARVHVKAPSAPIPTIADSVCSLIETDTALLSEFCSADTNETFVREVADVVGSTFTRDRADYEPTERDLSKALGNRRLAAAAYPVLSLSDKLACIRSLSRAEAVALAQRKVQAKQQALSESLCDRSGAISVTSPAERTANKRSGRLNWAQHARAKRKSASTEKGAPA